jgi:hypothetical protein
MVWVHVALATVTWIALLWATAAAGNLQRRRATVPARDLAAQPDLAQEPALVSR